MAPSIVEYHPSDFIRHSPDIRAVVVPGQYVRPRI
jgi:hypothetical protein